MSLHCRAAVSAALWTPYTWSQSHLHRMSEEKMLSKNVSLTDDGSWMHAGHSKVPISNHESKTELAPLEEALYIFMWWLLLPFCVSFPGRDDGVKPQEISNHQQVKTSFLISQVVSFWTCEKHLGNFQWEKLGKFTSEANLESRAYFVAFKIFDFSFQIFLFASIRVILFFRTLKSNIGNWNSCGMKFL